MGFTIFEKRKLQSDSLQGGLRLQSSEEALTSALSPVPPLSSRNKVRGACDIRLFCNLGHMHAMLFNELSFYHLKF